MTKQEGIKEASEKIQAAIAKMGRATSKKARFYASTERDYWINVLRRWEASN